MRKKLEALAEKAGAMMTKEAPFSVREKSSSKDLVTSRDLEVQEMLVGACRKLAPGCSFYCEEEHLQDLTESSEEGFIIDPIDGTANYVHGLGHSCTSIACLREGRIDCGVVFDPFRGEMFSASRKEGSFLNGRPLTVRDRPLREGLVCFGTSPYDEDTTDASFRLARRLYGLSGDIRRSGSAALDCCYAACGRYDLYFELRVSPWDHAAGSLIAAMAGCRTCTIEGAPLPLLQRTSVLCGTASGVAACLAEAARL